VKIAYFDCIAGASGDMILGALIDTGLSVETLRQRLAALQLDDEFALQARKVVKNGFQATKVDVILTGQQAEAAAHHGRRLADIQALLRRSALTDSLRERADAMFQRLAEVEAEIHHLSPQEVHLHEAGGIDTIVDIVGALIGLEVLGIQQVQASPLPLGRGFVSGAHGPIPLPAPATLALLKNVPIYGRDLDAELVTPTGALLLSSLSQAFGPVPPMKLQAVGYGAGQRDLPVPNLLRLIIGEQEDGMEQLLLLETNLDDVSAEILGYVMEKLFAAGALDVFFTPIQMKKNRPAIMLSVLARWQEGDQLEEILLRETSTLGVRRQIVERRALERFHQTVETPYGAIRIKSARLPDGSIKHAPEYEDCKRAAEQHGVPLRRVYDAARQRIEEQV